MRRLLSYFVAFVLSTIMVPLVLRAQAPNVSAVAHAVDEHYNRLKSLKSAFTETYQGPGISRSESGTLWLKKPGTMRWEYRQPREKLFLSDSQTAYFYVPGDRQARKTSVKKLDDIRSPLRYLLGKTKLEKELEGLSFAPDVQPIQQGDVVLRGVPKAMKDRVSDTLVEVSPSHQIVRIVIQEVDGTTTDFRFSQIEENVPVQDSLFRFSPPPGVETITDDHVAE
ncbi:MAG TPA: outer membrane lipoprotein chaperone LolA [Candidatus Angelobacter sp.]|nr:outer membrane lipoprotein chaperone LolA [Candidatus Angelobacter sp.]